MTTNSNAQLTLAESAPLPALDPDPIQASAAIERCCAAWQRAYKASMKKKNSSRGLATYKAGPAYCKAMPALAGRDSIRDFIACAAHGILIDAIPVKRANQLLYAAQVALASLPHEPKSQKTA